MFYIADRTIEEDRQTSEITLDELISNIECPFDEPRITLDKKFWDSYEVIKKYKPKHRSGSTNIKSLEQKAITALKGLLKINKDFLINTYYFVTLTLDIRKYRTLPDFTLGRLSLSGKKDQYEFSLRILRK